MGQGRKASTRQWGFCGFPVCLHVMKTQAVSLLQEVSPEGPYGMGTPEKSPGGWRVRGGERRRKGKKLIRWFFLAPASDRSHFTPQGTESLEFLGYMIQPS